jgi:hypothetical protein
LEIVLLQAQGPGIQWLQMSLRIGSLPHISVEEADHLVEDECLQFE